MVRIGFTKWRKSSKPSLSISDKGIDPKKHFPDAKHVIEYAFSVGEKHYFKYADHLHIPYERALSCLVYYREIDMNIGRDFLQEHLLAIRKILRSNQIDVFRINSLNEQLIQRLELPKDPELLYKLASVVFFDQHEKPEVYEYEYARKKIAYWKEAVSMKAFFSQKPLRDLIPYLEFAGENLETFSQMVEDKNKVHLANLSRQSSAK